MTRKPISMALALAGTMALAAAAPAFAEGDTGGSTNSKTLPSAAAQSGTAVQTGAANATGSMSTDAMTPGTMPKSTMKSRTRMGAAAGGGQSFSKTGASDPWADTYAKEHQGKLSRQAYMDEMGRRWDSMDKTQQGLTPAEVSHINGNVDSGAMPARTGSGVQSGNMGPGNQKGQ